MSTDNSFNENITYDKIGNITSLHRTGFGANTHISLHTNFAITLLTATSTRLTINLDGLKKHFVN